jgi:hypothetical protein
LEVKNVTKIQLKRGLEKDLPVLAEGEPAFTTDSWKFFVGSKNGNKQIFGGGGGSVTPNNQEWTSTDTQDTFLITNGSIPNIKSLFVFVGGVIQPNVTLVNSTSFKLPEPLNLGTDVFAIWFEEDSNSTVTINGTLENEYEWTAAEGQLTYILPSNTTYDPSSKALDVYVGGALVSPSLIQKDSSSQFTLLCSTSDINAGMKVLARWTQPYVSTMSGHHATHELNGADEIDVTKLKNYSNFIQTPINVLIGLNDYSTQYTYTGSGDIATETVTDSSNNVICTTTYNYSGTQLSTVVFTMNGTTVTSTYNYDGSGNLTSVVNVKS